MSDSGIVEWLSTAIGQATRSAKFCVARSLPAVDPSLEVEGLGSVTIPLKRPMAKALVASCQVAPYGKGTQTLVSKKVRNTFELDPKRFRLSDAWNMVISDVLAESIGSWAATQPAKPLVFALEHHYTERGLSLDLLKGADRQLADLVVAAAEKTDCCVHLPQVSRHLLQFADDGSFGRGDSRYGRSPPRDVEIGETYEDELSGTQWTDVGGKKQPWGEIAFDLSAIVSSTPIDDWKPTSEQFEGYTGNAGNTLS